MSATVFALRARGFESGHSYFESLDDITSTYTIAIRRQQSRGPYAIAGYSYGAMIAFEFAKRLEREDGEPSVQFLGIFNLPPHVKHRMSQLDWGLCLLNLCSFLGLMT